MRYGILTYKILYAVFVKCHSVNSKKKGGEKEPIKCSVQNQQNVEEQSLPHSSAWTAGNRRRRLFQGCSWPGYSCNSIVIHQHLSYTFLIILNLIHIDLFCQRARFQRPGGLTKFTVECHKEHFKA